MVDLRELAFEGVITVLPMPLILVLWLLVLPRPASAEFYFCPDIDGGTYTESPSRSDCRLLAVQPPPLVYERQNSGLGVTARAAGPWPQGSVEAMAEICAAYREWIMLDRRRYAYPYDVPPPSLTPQDVKRLNNLDVLFAHRGQPNCDRQ